MKQIPSTNNPIIIRTDFSNEASWDAILAIIRRDFGTIPDFVEFIQDQEYEGIDTVQLLTLLPSEYEHSFIVLADNKSMLAPDYPLLVIDLMDDPGLEFRTLPGELFGISSNLSISNMDFEEFADSVDEDGVFRGF